MPLMIQLTNLIDAMSNWCRFTFTLYKGMLMYKKNSTYLLGDAAYTRFLKKLPSLLTSASLQLKRNVILNRYRAEA